MPRFLIAALVFASLATSASAQSIVKLIGLAAQPGRIAEADKLIAEKKWSEAVDALHGIMADAGEDLVPLEDQHALQARYLCFLRLAALPPEALRLHRARVDAQAKKWLDQGQANRDPAMLRRLVEESFCSRHTDQALDLLGDLSFERGDFEEAERWWKLLALPASQKDRGPARDQLLFPDPQVDVARVRAKQLLARLFRGADIGFLAEFNAFQKAHPKAEGQLAGKKGNYATLLQALMDQDSIRGSVAEFDGWPTFGGRPNRNRVLPEKQGRLARIPQLDGPQWSVRLDTGERVREPRLDGGAPGKILSWAEAARSLAHQPVIVGDRVYVADARVVRGYELATGRRVYKYDLFEDGKTDETAVPTRIPAEPESSFTLTAYEDRLYARMGTPLIGPRRQNLSGRGDLLRDSFLVCLNLQPGATGSLEKWNVKAQSTENRVTFFEGAPVVQRGKVYVPMTRCVDERTFSIIACHDAETGAVLWQRDICETEELKSGDRRVRTHLLCLAGPRLVYCSHSGVVAALETETGRRLWSSRYESTGLKTAEGKPIQSPRSLVPPMFADGRIYVAPVDCNRILCFDAATGHILWESSPVEVVHLLGVARGRLIFTAHTPQDGIRALDAANGAPIPGWSQPGDDSNLPSFGRGLLAGECVFWPTQNGVHVLRQDTGEWLASDPDIHGNLATSNGCLVAASLEYLTVHVPDSLLLRQREHEVSEKPSAMAHYRLARSEIDAGVEERAMASLELAAKLLPAGDRLQSSLRPLRHRALLQLAAKSGDREPAERHLREATSSSFSIQERLTGIRHLAQLGVSSGRPQLAVEAWQSILENKELRESCFTDSRELPQSAAWLASRSITQLIEQHGPSVYAAIETRAEKLLQSLQNGKGEEVLDRLGREFPERPVYGTTPVHDKAGSR